MPVGCIDVGEDRIEPGTHIEAARGHSLQRPRCGESVVIQAPLRIDRRVHAGDVDLARLELERRGDAIAHLKGP